MIKILLGGSPCTHWSVAQKNNRETQPNSGLGWELFLNYKIALEKYKPDYFLYENNKSASQAIKDEICNQLGSPLQYINSALVSAQNRERFYVHNWENFNQGLDIRFITSANVELINRIKVKEIHFAWDNAKDDLKPYFESYKAIAKHKPHGRFGTVYCLTNFGSTMEENLYRIYTLRDLGYDPYVMIYDKPNAPREVKKLQRWCNNRFVFRSCEKFEDYMKGDSTYEKGRDVE